MAKISEWQWGVKLKTGTIQCKPYCCMVSENVQMKYKDKNIKEDIKMVLFYEF